MEPQIKQIRLSGGARRLIKEKENAVKNNQSIMSFLVPKNTQEPSSEFNCSEEEDNPSILHSLGMYLNLS